MTLSTNIYLTGPVDAKEVFDFCNTLLGAENPYFDHEESSWDPGRWQYMNHPGQGYSAWLAVYYKPDGPLSAEDVWDVDGDYRWLSEKACTVKVNFDTAYGYRDKLGGCASLHGRYIAVLDRWAKDHGATLEWQNEFTGEHHKGTEGLEDFGGEEVKASEWVGKVMQAIQQEMGRNAVLKQLGADT